jgi:hypothetical protein
VQNFVREVSSTRPASRAHLRSPGEVSVNEGRVAAGTKEPEFLAVNLWTVSEIVKYFLRW